MLKRKICDKSANYTSRSLLNKFAKKFFSVIGDRYLIYGKDLAVKEGIIHIPFYTAPLL